ncbi:MAG TPA: VanZ family protein [Polyangia bacterium]|jgi:VanZ family protein
MRSASGRCDRPTLTDVLPVAGLVLLSFLLSSIPGQKIPPVPVWQFDKLVHASLFGVLGLLLARPLARPGLGLGVGAQVFAAMCLASAWGALDEMHQLFTPNRSCDVRDWVADTVGALLGALLLLAWRRWRAAAAPTRAEARP